MRSDDLLGCVAGVHPAIHTSCPGPGTRPAAPLRSLPHFVPLSFGAVLGDQPRRWWQPKARCPGCRTVIERVERGAPIGPVLIRTYGQPGPCAEVITEYEVRFLPGGHRFRRIMRATDLR